MCTHTHIHLAKSFLKNSPAELTKEICVGDIIVEVDREQVEGWSLSELAERILGPTGSVVECSFRRKADGELYTVKVARGRNALSSGPGSKNGSSR
mmetsp:Transcript_96874/g.141710  ORF Transcript_96874/g.141710 Transcript_96874/m.141710 type:complete len:96 (+) Transcript_96874:174-461(+)